MGNAVITQTGRVSNNNTTAWTVIVSCFLNVFFTISCFFHEIFSLCFCYFLLSQIWIVFVWSLILISDLIFVVSYYFGNSALRSVCFPSNSSCECVCVCVGVFSFVFFKKRIHCDRDCEEAHKLILCFEHQQHGRINHAELIYVGFNISEDDHIWRTGIRTWFFYYKITNINK